MYLPIFSTTLCAFFLTSVNVAHTPAQGLQGTATMSQPSQDSTWSATKAVDGNTEQETLSTCAMMDYSKNYKSVWWKVRLGRRFNVAYIVVYFRKSSMLPRYVFIAHCYLLYGDKGRPIKSFDENRLSVGGISTSFREPQ